MKQTRRRANAARLIWIRESPPITLTVALAMLICGGLGLVRVARAAAAAPSVPQATEKPAAAKPPYYEQYAALAGLFEDRDSRLASPEEVAKFGIVWPDVPPEQNAAVDYAKAHALHAPRDEDGPAGLMTGITPYAGDKVAFEQWVRKNQAVLDAFLAATAKKVCLSPVVVDPETREPIIDYMFFNRLRQLARTCSDAGLVEEVNGCPVAAATWYLACLRMGAQVRTSGGARESGVGWGIGKLAESDLQMLIANVDLPAETLRKILTATEGAAIGPRELAEAWKRAERPRTLAVRWLSSPERGQDVQVYVAIVDELLSHPLDKLLLHEELFDRFSATTEEVKRLAGK